MRAPLVSRRGSRRVALVLTALCLATVAAPAQAQSAPPRYVALGDSYTAGEGLDPYLPGSDTAANQCHRSPLSHPALVRPEGSAPELTLLACSGAAIANVMPGGPAQWDEGAAQLDRGALDAATALVTITIGGNDAQFTPTLQQCAFRNCLGLRVDDLPFPEWLSRRIDALAEPLAGVYTAVADRAPAARVLVMGYPNLFPATVAEQSCWSLFPWNPGEQAFIRDATAHLERVSAAAVATVAATGRNVAFVPMTGRFAGHEACGTAGEWISGPRLDELEQSFHPLAEGQAAFAGAAEEALGRPPAPTAQDVPELPVPDGPAPGSFGTLGVQGGCRATVTADGLRPGSAARLTLTPLGGAARPWGRAAADAAGRAHVTLDLPHELAGWPVLAEARGDDPGGAPRIEAETLRVPVGCAG